MTYIWFGLSALLVLADQWTKQLALAHLTLGRSEAITPFFDLTLAFNRGAAFSFLSEAGGWQRWFFIVLSATVSLVIAVWIRRLGGGQRWLALGLALILGGALGNLYDRVVLGYVVDFVSLHYRHYYWPAFNLADAAITGGALLLVADMFVNGDNPELSGGKRD